MAGLSGAGDLSAEEVLRLLELTPLPGEGGFFRETYRSRQLIPLETRSPEGAVPGMRLRSVGTCIYYFLSAGTYSALHRLTTDEVYHFYRGDPVELTLFHESRGLSAVVLGSSFERGERVQYVVPAGTWQGSRLSGSGRWALMGTTMSPGFEVDECTFAKPDLLQRFPEHAEALRPLLASGV